MFHRSPRRAAVAGLLLALSGCSDPEPQRSTGPLADGAFKVVFGTAMGGGCIIKPHVAQVGEVTENKIGSLLTSGQQGAEVSCSVLGSGGEFSAEVSIFDSGDSLTVDLPKLTLSATEADPASGSVVLVTAQTVKPYTSPPAEPCAFFFTGKEEVAAGRLWVSFSCPLLENASTGSSCGLGASVLAVQNCSH